MNIPTVFLLSSTLATGGSEMVIRALALGLPVHGFKPHVICLRGLGEIGMDISRQGVITHFGILRRRIDPAALVRLVGILRRQRRALLLTLDHHDAVFLGAWAAQIAAIRHRIVAIHSTGLWSKGSSFSRSDRAVLGKYHRIVALADSHADYLERREGIARRKIAVINNGIDPDRFKPAATAEDRRRRREVLGLPTDSFVVTIVAALRPEKNHEMLLRAAEQLVCSGSRYTFLIVGEGTEAEKLHALTRERALGESVRFLGRREDVPEILSVSDVSVLCSHPVVETFPLSVLESMACGVPVVATSVGSIPEMIGDGTEGVLVRAGDIAGLRDAIASLERDPHRRSEMGTRARSKVVERFTRDRMVGAYAELFRGMMGGQQP